QVAAGDPLHGQHGEPLAPHSTSGPLLRHVGGGDDVVGHHVGQLLEPPQRELGEDLALVRDGGGQHDVVDAHAVGGHQDEVVTVGVDVTHLAGVQQFHVFPTRRSRSCGGSSGGARRRAGRNL